MCVYAYSHSNTVILYISCYLRFTEFYSYVDDVFSGIIFLYLFMVGKLGGRISIGEATFYVCIYVCMYVFMLKSFFIICTSNVYKSLQSIDKTENKRQYCYIKIYMQRLKLFIILF